MTSQIQREERNTIKKESQALNQKNSGSAHIHVAIQMVQNIIFSYKADATIHDLGVVVASVDLAEDCGTVVRVRERDMGKAVVERAALVPNGGCEYEDIGREDVLVREAGMALCAKIQVGEEQRQAKSDVDGGDALDAPAEQERDGSVERA
ncbi:hypothetical protein HYDPIDRAFT_30826 [Hydnomerulius pinastri MD-312]|uniref:Uncharacterized protein n=1 Tax=Hydnomerulius pinastri MD-312 TaxID=994086 RepID=A0A0C9WCC9_9AGAM|nr:hypothetical protein HYDPIDRAFT_30826 [Hydnomerulius pinastri MD-312]